MHPTASRIPKGSSGVAFSYFTDKAPDESHAFRALSATYAPRDDLEVSLFRSEGVTGSTLSTNGLSLKYVLPHSERRGADVALCLTAFQGELDGWGAQLVASRRLTPERSKRRFDLHAGLQHLSWRGGEFRGTDLTPFVGLSGRLTPSVSVSAERRGREDWSLKNAYALGLHFQLQRQWTLTIGEINTGFSQKARPYVAVSWGSSLFVPR